MDGQQIAPVKVHWNLNFSGLVSLTAVGLDVYNDG